MIKYKCDYCGGFEVPYEVPQVDGVLADVPCTNVALRLECSNPNNYPWPKDRPMFNLDVCIWCWKKVFDKVLGNEQGGV